MGHMDVIGIISHGFNIYFPMAILLFCFATYFSLGSRFLSMLGFHQFVGDEEMTTDLVEEGRELVTRGMWFVLMFEQFFEEFLQRNGKDKELKSRLIGGKSFKKGFPQTVGQNS